jgi:hypothetical protein
MHWAMWAKVAKLKMFHRGLHLRADDSLTKRMYLVFVTIFRLPTEPMLSERNKHSRTSSAMSPTI